MASTEAAEPGRLRVFISYSRKDEDFAQELLGGLELAGFEPYLDKHDVERGADWEERLNALILMADTVVFIISPRSVRSPVGNSGGQSRVSPMPSWPRSRC